MWSDCLLIVNTNQKMDEMWFPAIFGPWSLQPDYHQARCHEPDTDKRETNERANNITILSITHPPPLLSFNYHPIRSVASSRQYKTLEKCWIWKGSKWINELCGILYTPPILLMRRSWRERRERNLRRKRRRCEARIAHYPQQLPRDQCWGNTGFM